MSTRWLVAVDDSEFSTWAFNYTLSLMGDQDHIYLMHVADQPATVFVGYASPTVMESLYKVEEEKARKILVHYGHKAKQAGVHFTMMKGTNSNPGELLCKAVENYKIDNCVIGRRGLGGFERFFSGSTSKYVMENAECNVIVVKRPFGPPEEHDPGLKARVIQAEEHERLRRIEESEEGLQVEHDTTVEEVRAAEEEERERRIKEQTEGTPMLKKFITCYQFHDDILKLGKKHGDETTDGSAAKQSVLV